MSSERGTPNNTPDDGPSRERRARAALTGANLAAAGPLASYEEVDHIGALIARLDVMLEGSRCSLEKLRGTLNGELVLEIATVGAVEKQLDTAAQALERMSELVHNAMQGPSLSLGAPAIARSRPVTLGEAVAHAVELLTPLARSRNVELHVDIPGSVAGCPSGPLYTVVLNGLQNAVESISRRGVAGRVDVTVKHDRAPVIRGYGRDTRDWQVLEIIDDGAGLPGGVDAGRLFDLGFTTKPRGTGVGLAVAKNVVQGMGGTIELTGREGVRGGALLRVRFPSPASGTLRMGGAA